MLPHLSALLWSGKCNSFISVSVKALSSACRSKLSALKATGDPIAFRSGEASARPQAVAAARQLLGLIDKTANTWPNIKPWLNETDIKGLTDQVFYTMPHLKHIASSRRGRYASLEILLRLG